MLSHAIEVLGWTLLHFVWQGAVVGVLAAAMLLTLRRRSANARYLIAVSALGLMLLLPLGTMAWIEQTPPVGEVSPIFNTVSTIEIPRTRDDGTLALDEPPIKVERIGIDFDNPPPADAVPLIPVSDTGKTILEDLAEQRSAFDAESFLKPFIPWAVAVWLIGVGVLSLRLFASWLSVLRLRRRATQPASADWQAMLGRLAERLRVTRPVKLVESALVEVPAVIGWLRPVILLPASAMTGLTTEQLEALLAHELAHVRRHDYLINLLQTVVETLLFYHPAVWWVSHRIRVEREHCCDDLVVRVLDNRVEYGRALLAIEELRTQRIVLALGATDGSLLARVRRIVGVSPDRPNDRWPVAFIGLVAIGLVLTLAIGTFVSSRAEVTAPITENNPSAERELPDSAAGRESPDPTLDPTAGLPNSDEETNPPNNANGDLRSNPAAGSGDPRRAQVAPKRSPNPLVTVLQPVANAPLDSSGEVMPTGMVQRLGSNRFKVLGWWRRLAFAGNDEWVWLKADERVSVIHRETGRVVKHYQLRLGEDTVCSLTASADGTRVAIGMFEPTNPSDFNKQTNYRVVVMSALTTAHLQKLKWKGRPSDLTCLSFSGDGNTLLTGTQRGDVWLWNVETGELLRQQAFEEGADLRDAAMSPDGRSAVLGGWQKSFFWKLADNAGPIKLAKDRGDSVSFASNGRLFSTIGRDGPRLWNAENGELIAHLKSKEFQSYGDADFGHSFTPDSKVLAVPLASYDVVELWDVESKQRLATLPVHRPRGVAISRDGRWLAASGQDSATAIFDLKTRKQVSQPGSGHGQEILSVRFAGVGSLVSVSMGDARVWDIKSGQQQHTLPRQNEGSIRGLATSPDGTLIVTSVFDDTLGVWNRATGKRLFTLKGHGTLGGSRPMQFQADGSQFVSWGDDAVLRWWNPKDGRLLSAETLEVPGYKYPQDELSHFGLYAAFAPDAKSLFVSYGELFEFDTRTGQRLRRIPAARTAVSMSASLDGRWLATAEDGADRTSTIVLRDRATLKVVREWLVSDPREAVATDTSNVAQGNDSPDAKKNRQPTFRFTADGGNGMTFSPDSKRLAWSRAGTRNGIDIADVTHDRVVVSIPVESRCLCLEFSPDGKQIAAGHADSTASVWDLANPAFSVAEVKDRANHTNGENGDLRSNPAAGSGEPRLAQQDLKSEISNLKSQISDPNAHTVKSAAQLKGQIRWIDKSKGMVWINLGQTDGVARPMRFQVREKADPKNGNQPQAVKGQIEVSRVIDGHTSEARIIQDDQNNAVAKGDEIVQLVETTQPNDKPKEEQRKLPPPKGEIYDAASPGSDRIKPKQGSVSGAISGNKRREGEPERLDQFTGRVRLKTEKPLPDLEKVIVPAGKVLDESLVFSKDGGLANVVVYLPKPTFPIEPPPSDKPPKPFVLIAEGERFWPHVAFVRVGRPVVFENRRTDQVNFRMAPLKNVSFNVLVKVEDHVNAQAFRHPENIPFSIKSDIQPWMQSYVLTLDHPFAAVTDEEGRFTINGLPPGDHEFRVWHERVGYLEKKLPVTIKAGENLQSELEFTPDRFQLTEADVMAWRDRLLDATRVPRGLAPRPAVKQPKADDAQAVLPQGANESFPKDSGERGGVSPPVPSKTDAESTPNNRGADAAPLAKLVEPDDQPRRKLIERGIEFLKAKQQENGTWQGQPLDGVTALAAAALLQAGVKADDPVIQKALVHLRKVEPALSYTVALQTMVFCWASPKEDAELIRRNVAWLEKAQVPDGKSRGAWSYPANPNGRGDGSCSRFAILGLDAAKRAGFEVKEETWRRASDYWLTNQKENGGWGYTAESPPTLSMTLSGVAGLATANRHLPDEEQRKVREAAIRKPAQFIEKSMSGLPNATFVFYVLHSLERAGHLTGNARFGELDWNAELTKRLTESQHPNGFWKGATATEGDLIATSLALLALSGQPEPKQIGYRLRFEPRNVDKPFRMLSKLIENSSPPMQRTVISGGVRIEFLKPDGLKCRIEADRAIIESDARAYEDLDLNLESNLMRIECIGSVKCEDRRGAESTQLIGERLSFDLGKDRIRIEGGGN